jgi:hypothetical protein
MIGDHTTEVFVINGNVIADISELIETIRWGGGKNKAARSVSLDLTYTKRGLHQTVPIEEGYGLIFRRDKQELFRGTVWDRDRNGSGGMTITVYDQLIYMANNKDTYLFTKKKASDILKKLCGDFDIPMGTIVDTGYAIPYLLFDGDTLYDMVMRALYLTYKQTGVKYSLFSKEGKVHLIKKIDNLKKWVIESGTNLVDYSYKTSLDGTATKVKLRAGEEKKTIIAVAENKEMQKKFGILQHYERISEKISQAELNARAKQILAKEGKVKKTFTLNNVLGIPDVITGTAIHVVVPELGIGKGYYVEEDTHTFVGQKHLMNLTLTETDEIPEIKVGQDQPPKPTKAESKNSKKKGR